ncbi:hypothetical protein PBRA_008623 [Plasmodiophora brassicae]|uniref:non-specific serine/threonine protein kinase n=1 Tax=Plasmodiophora brassicae TaxID=37360 RepID=A0A0G4J370_PLABS|nr:hypothetical protein PBRA_008623 [Plasmodiophora brassicae]
MSANDASPAQLAQFRDLLVNGAEFDLASADGKAPKRRWVWLNKSLDTICWGDSRKAWRYKEAPLRDALQIDEVDSGDAHELRLGLDDGRQMALTSPSYRQRNEFANALRRRDLLRDLPQTSSPFNVQHLSHVDVNLEWTGDLSKMFDLETKLGQGSFGSVYRARHKDSGVVMAVKLVVSDNMEEIRKEIDILKQCKHTDIVSYYGCGSGLDAEGQLWILMDYCDARDVGVVLDSYGPLPEDVIQYIMLHSVRATVYLHAKRIIHRDIKSGNILLTSDASVKLGDFGVSKQAATITSDKPEMAGSPLWMAPEVVKGRPAAFSSDVWSLGITAIELADGKPPRANLTAYQAMKAIAKDPPPTLSSPSKWSEPFRQFVQARPSAVDLLMHPFLSQTIKEDKVKQRLKSIIAKKARRASSLGSRLKDITDKAQKAMSRSPSGSASPREQDDLIIEAADGDDNAYGTAIIREFDDDDAVDPAMGTALLDNARADATAVIRQDAEPDPTTTDSTGQLVIVKPQRKAGASPMPVIAIAVAVGILVVALALRFILRSSSSST